MTPQSRRRENDLDESVGRKSVPFCARRSSTGGPAPGGPARSAGRHLKRAGRQGSDGSLRRALVNAALILPLLCVAGCAGLATPGRFALTWMEWSLQDYDRCFDEGCIRPAGKPVWSLTTSARDYDSSGYTILGTGDGTLDLAPRGFDPEARPALTNIGPRRVEGIATPLALELSQVARTQPFVRLYLQGGGVLDARWVERGSPEARGEDVLGNPFTLPDDNIVLAQGREVVAGSGAGRVGLRVTGQDGVARVEYGLNAGAYRQREAALALPNGAIRIPVGDLREGSIHSRGMSAMPSRLYAFVWRYPRRIISRGPPALLVSLGSILAAPVHRPPAGANARAVPSSIAVRIGETGVEEGRLWIALLPPEGSDGIWAVRADEIRARWWESGGETTQVPAGHRDQELTRPMILDPVRGTKLWFFAGKGIPGEFDLEIDAVHATDGKTIEKAVYKMDRRGRVRWNPVGVFRDWTCHEMEFEP